VSECDIDRLERLFQQLQTEDRQGAVAALVEFVAENGEDIIKTLRTAEYSR